MLGRKAHVFSFQWDFHKDGILTIDHPSSYQLQISFYMVIVRPTMKLAFLYGTGWNICDFNAILCFMKQFYFFFVLGGQQSWLIKNRLCWSCTFAYPGMFGNMNYKRAVVEEFCLLYSVVQAERVSGIKKWNVEWFPEKREYLGSY